MDSTQIIYIVRDVVYATQAVIGLYSAYLLILMFRRLARMRFRSQAAAGQFLEKVREHLATRDVRAVAELCDSPPYWNKTAPQLILIALQNSALSPAKLRRLLGESFENDVLSDFDMRTSWIITSVKSAPMLGLLGTVLALIAAFGKIATMQQTGTDPRILADDISHALMTTAFGLIIAIPLTLFGNMIHVRVGRLRVQAQQMLAEFMRMYSAAFDPAERRQA